MICCKINLISDPSPLPSNCTDYDIRLNDHKKNSMNRGIVEMCLNGVWGTVCHGGLDYGAPQLMCAQLGFYGVGKRSSFNSFL